MRVLACIEELREVLKDLDLDENSVEGEARTKFLDTTKTVVRCLYKVQEDRYYEVEDIALKMMPWEELLLFCKAPTQMEPFCSSLMLRCDTFANALWYLVDTRPISVEAFEEGLSQFQ